MCGRFTIISDPVAFQLEFDIPIEKTVEQDWKARYNVAPAQLIPVVAGAPERSLAAMQWGLLPAWAREKRDSFRLINVRAETIMEKVTFRKLLQKEQRCLILADGFYEWQASSQPKLPKTPFYFRLKDHKPFAFAGLWDYSTLPDGQTAQTCAIITCAPNALVGRVHDRMPVILTAQTGRAWLENQPVAQLLPLLSAFPASEMDAYPVGALINSPANDSPECILPAG